MTVPELYTECCMHPCWQVQSWPAFSCKGRNSGRHPLATSPRAPCTACGAHTSHPACWSNVQGSAVAGFTPQLRSCRVLGSSACWTGEQPAPNTPPPVLVVTTSVSWFPAVLWFWCHMCGLWEYAFGAAHVCAAVVSTHLAAAVSGSTAWCDA